ncbi:MAG: transcription elongation factor GreA [bacterium]|nr:transcription elongation factor GreA [bacterium]
MRSPEFQFNKAEDLAENSEYLSSEGFDGLQKELEELKIKRRQEIADRLEYAKSLGDLTENTEYQSAKDDQISNEIRIAEIEDILSRAVLISKEHGANIQLGSVISIKKESNDAVNKYSLVGAEEADPMEGKISNESPLGSSLIGKKKGDTIEVITPKGKITYTIIDVE